MFFRFLKNICFFPHFYTLFFVYFNNLGIYWWLISVIYLLIYVPILSSLEKSHQTRCTCNGKRMIKLYFLEGKIIWNFSVRKCSQYSHIYFFFNHLYQYKREIYFIICIIIRYYSMSYVVQVVPASVSRTYFRLTPVSLLYSFILLFFEH